MKRLDEEARRVLTWLDAHRVEYELLEHIAVRSMEDCAPIAERLKGTVPKNLFLAPRNKSRYYLCLLHPQTPFVTARMSKALGSSRLSFAGEGELLELLHCASGAASPLGLMFESAAGVVLAVDERLKECDRLIFHPCSRQASVAMAGSDFFEKVLANIGARWMWFNDQRETTPT